ncbi:MAG TPA: DUF1801 domain-containing protein [Rhizomicrobium sp.]|jgi:hypothetical protein|nr:DUF1801 domain-containing protein [Rhizomicrobium sp.]
MKPVTDPSVAEAFRAFPPAPRKRLLALREMIYEVAAATPGVGVLDETLKWGEPAYLTPSGAGSTVRLGWKAKAPGEVAMYFICTTGLVDRFREIYPRDFRFGGNRALLFDLAGEVPETALRHCIALALTNKLR